MRSLLRAEELTEGSIEAVLDRAQAFANGQSLPTLNAAMVNLFFEPSTRTSLSFQMAAHRLGIKLLDFSLDTSSVCKGESFLDTLSTIDSLGVDIAVIRHRDPWPDTPGLETLQMRLINAGSGVLEHPTQALLDALTMQQAFSTLRGRSVVIVGDAAHSRVARSNAAVLRKLGAHVFFAGPPEYRPNDLPAHVSWVDGDLDYAIRKCDAVMMLRIQHERHETSFNIRNYNEQYGMNQRRLHLMKKDAILLHPGPVNRGVEIAADIIDHPRCRINQQVANGVSVRMALLEMCLQEGRHEKLASA